MMMMTLLLLVFQPRAWNCTWLVEEWAPSLPQLAPQLQSNQIHCCTSIHCSARLSEQLQAPTAADSGCSPAYLSASLCRYLTYES